MSAPYAPASSSKTDFLIVTALPEERDAVLAYLPRHEVVPQTVNDTRVYFRSELAVANRGSFDVTVLLLPGMGRVNAAAATNDGIRRWQPEYVLMVGIAGGFSRNGAALGDVLLSTEVLDYELQKLRQESIEYRPTIPPLSHRLLSAAQNYMKGDWIGRIQVPRPTPGDPRTVFGPVATGDKVINDPKAIERLMKLSPKLVGVEMEAGGAGAASHQAETNFYMVRGVSDLADGTKDEPRVVSWRAYACHVAAAYAVGLLQSGLLPPSPKRLPGTDYGEISGAVQAAVNAVRLFDTMSDQVESVLTGSPAPAVPRAHRLRFEGGGIEIVARREGRIDQTITGQDLQKLPPQVLRHVKVLEASMENYYSIWEKVHPRLALMADPVSRAQVQQQLKHDVIAPMGSELNQILSFLEDCGFHLDDHYLHVRDLVNRETR